MAIKITRASHLEPAGHPSSSPGPKARRSPAFTLVELLVVIGIIALLISILLPSLTRARREAQRAVCLSNLRQIVIAATCYAFDNRGACVPTATYVNWFANDTIDGLTGPATMTWDAETIYGPLGRSASSFKRGWLGRYLGSEQVLECPAIANLALPPLSKGRPNTSYGMALTSVIRLADARNASDTALCGDAITYDRSTNTFLRPVQLTRPGLGTRGDTFHGRHANGFGSLGFFDGHAESVPAQLKPQESYDPSFSITAETVSVLQKNHIGPACPTKINFAAYATYDQQCRAEYDYYFWANKSARR